MPREDPDRERGLQRLRRARSSSTSDSRSRMPCARSSCAHDALAHRERRRSPARRRATSEHINRFSASFAFATDVAMLSLGGYLKKKENLSARLGDVLSSDVSRARWC